MTAEGLRVDESAVNGGVKCPKYRKTRMAPLAIFTSNTIASPISAHRGQAPKSPTTVFVLESAH
jgi:hypothetical protein